MLEVIMKRFEAPDETRVFDKGKFEIVKIGGMTIGRASYEPGWKWSEDVGPLAGTPLCEVEHVGMVIAGRAMAATYATIVWLALRPLPRHTRSIKPAPVRVRLDARRGLQQPKRSARRTPTLSIATRQLAPHIS